MARNRVEQRRIAVGKTVLSSLPEREIPMLKRACSRLQSTLLPVALLLIITPTPAVHAQSFNVLYDFGMYGAHPQTGLTIDARGSLYGTTSRITGNAGTVFKLSYRGSGWVLSPLRNFQGGTDGAAPLARPVFGPGGLLYGSTAEGGGSGCQGYGCGTLYSLRPSARAPEDILQGWDENILFRFTGGDTGSAPSGDLLFDQSGTMYGTDDVGVAGWGAVYSLTPQNGMWKQTVLYNFTGGSDGGGIFGGVIRDSIGRLYGAAFTGGGYGNGTVFRLTPSGSGWSLESLYNFQGGADGKNPAAGLTSDASGNLYGTTLYGGSDGGGTVFMLSPSGGSWNLTVLYSFTGPAGSEGSLSFDVAGNLYGTTFADGVYAQGNVFKLSPANGGWTYTSLHDFTGGDDGAMPDGGVVFDSAGNIYGTTENGGHQFGNGVVWEITP